MDDQARSASRLSEFLEKLSVDAEKGKFSKVYDQKFYEVLSWLHLVLV